MISRVTRLEPHNHILIKEYCRQHHWNLSDFYEKAVLDLLDTEAPFWSPPPQKTAYVTVRLTKSTHTQLAERLKKDRMQLVIGLHTAINQFAQKLGVF